MTRNELVKAFDCAFNMALRIAREEEREELQDHTKTRKYFKLAEVARVTVQTD